MTTGQLLLYTDNNKLNSKGDFKMKPKLLLTIASVLYILGGIAGWIGWGTASGQSVSPHTAVDVTAVFCAARVIAEGIGQMPVSG